MQEEASLKAMPIPKEEASLKPQMKKDETKKAPKKDEILRSFFVHP